MGTRHSWYMQLVSGRVPGRISISIPHCWWTVSISERCFYCQLTVLQISLGRRHYPAEMGSTRVFHYWVDQCIRMACTDYFRRFTSVSAHLWPNRVIPSQLHAATMAGLADLCRLDDHRLHHQRLYEQPSALRQSWRFHLVNRRFCDCLHYRPSLLIPGIRVCRIRLHRIYQ